MVRLLFLLHAPFDSVLAPFQGSCCMEADVFALVAFILPGQFAAEKNFNMALDLPRGKAHVEHLSWTPRVFYHHNFLSDSDITSFMAGFANGTAGKIKPWNGNGDWFEAVQKRIARFAQEPIDNFEQGFFLKYAVGGETESQRDWYECRA